MNAEHPKQQSDKKWRKKIHRLQLQLQQTMEELSFYKKECQRLQFENRSLKKQLITYSTIPQIPLKYDYLFTIQQSQLQIIDTIFQHNQYLFCEDSKDLFSQILINKLEIPSILHLSILRKYYLHNHCEPTFFFDPSSYKSKKDQGSFQSKSSQCSNHLLFLPPSELERGLNICVVEHQSFSDWWKLTFLGYDNKERLFQSLCMRDMVTFECIKQMICDFLYWNIDIQAAVHDAFLAPSSNEFIMCCHHCIYITTVATAILFNLTGLVSKYVGKREFMHSNLYSILQLLDKKPITLILPFAPSYSQQIFTRFESLCDQFEKKTFNQPCTACLYSYPNWYHQLTISASQLMNSMNPKLSPLCFRRAFCKIFTFLGHPLGAQIKYEAYVMFNILYNVFL